MTNLHAARVVVPLRPGSDGDAQHRPVGPAYIEVDPPTLYLEKLALQWMQARDEALPRVTYTLERLPTGYALFKKPRLAKPSHVDKWLYGHPDHKTFDSPNRFFPHFLHLMENGGDKIGCPCTVCNHSGGSLPPRVPTTSSSHSSSGNTSSPVPTGANAQVMPSTSAPALIASHQKGRPKLIASHQKGRPKLIASHQKGRPKLIGTGIDASRVDEEGTPDVYRNLIDKLKRHNALDEPIREPWSLDWRAEQEILPALLTKLRRDPQWIPRTGDMVLYLRAWPDGLEILQHPSTGQFQFYDPDRKAFLGVPAWEAGHVGQPPAETVEDDQDLEKTEEWHVSYSGVRVEQLPNPNDPNGKFVSKRYRYVPVRHTRPFILWKDCLTGTPQDGWHWTITNALTLMATVSLMGKHRFRGQWPNAQIYCHGIYIGSEMLAIGDTVRLLPKSGDPACTDVLMIKSIRLKLSSLDKASENDYDEGRPYNSEVWIFGSAYTNEASRCSREWLSSANTESPKAGLGYSRWYPLHPPNKELAVPFSRLLGRLHEYDAMGSCLPSDASPTLDQGREGLLEGRAFARANDKRVASSFGAVWFWGDSRAEALDLETINGLEVSKFDSERDPREWRKKIKVMDGVSKEPTRAMAEQAVGGIKGLQAFWAPATATGQHPTRNNDSESSYGNASSLQGQNGAPVVHPGSHDDDEIRRYTRIIRDAPSSNQKKRAKVTVVID